MAEKYEEKKTYYIPAYVEQIQELGNYPVKVSFRIGEERCDIQLENSPDLLFTAEEVARANGVYTTPPRPRDEVVAENRELKAKIKTADETAETLKTKADAMTVTADSLQKENEELKAKIAELTAWYEEANKTASEAAEANDELKTQIAELKAERDKFAKTAKDKADLANKACDERNDVQGDLETAKAIVNHLQEENKDLKQKLEDAEACYTVVADTSIKRKSRVTTMEEVIVALVEKIRRLEGDD